MRVLILILAALPAWATSYAVSAAGCLIANGGCNWSTATNFTPNGTPGNGDTINVPNTYKLIMDSSRTIGGSGATGTAAITLNASGVLELAQDTTLTARGDVNPSYTNGAETDAVIFKPGSKIILDPSVAADPPNTYYILMGATATRGVYAMCTAAKPCTITSYVVGEDDCADATKPACGQFGKSAVSTHGARLTGDHVIMQHLGSPTRLGWAWALYGAYAQQTTSLTNFVIDHTGGMGPSAGTANHSNTSLIMENGTFSNTMGLASFDVSWNTGAAGTRRLKHIVFDRAVGYPASVCSGASNSLWGFVGNTNLWFNRGTCYYGQSFDSSVFRWVNQASLGYSSAANSGGTSGSYFIRDTQWLCNTRGVVNVSTSTQASMIGGVYDVRGASICDSGELYFSMTGTSGHTAQYSNMLTLPLPTGMGHGKLGTFTSTTPAGVTWAYDHNTLVIPAASYAGGFGMMDLDESGAAVGTVYLRSNMGIGNSAGVLGSKVRHQGATYSTDALVPVRVSHNAGYNVVASAGGYCVGCDNQANGYVAKFSDPGVVPGANDPDVLGGGTGTAGGNAAANPHIDLTKRRLATIDQLYYGVAKATDWAASTAYAKGAKAAVLTSGSYADLPINYYALKAHTSSNETKPETGVHTSAGGHITSCVMAGSALTLEFASPHSLALWDGPIDFRSLASGNGSGYVTAVTSPTIVVVGNMDDSGVDPANGTYTDCVVATWRAFWDYNGAVEVMTRIPNGTVYTDGAIGVVNVGAVEVLRQFARVPPNNPRLWCAGHDGETIGAVPFCGKGKALLGAIQ